MERKDVRARIRLAQVPEMSSSSKFQLPIAAQTDLSCPGQGKFSADCGVLLHGLLMKCCN